MPYCLACGTKTDFEPTDCPSCGQAITHRIDPPGDEAEDAADDSVAEAIGATESGEAAEGSAVETGAADDPADADPAGQSSGEASEAQPPETAPAGPSPFENSSAVALAARYPFRPSYTPLVVGTIVTTASIVLPFLWLLTAGYAVRLARAVARGQTEQPAFEDAGGLAVDGLKALVVVAVYAIVLAIGIAIAGAVGGVAGALVAVGAALAVAYPLPASLTAVAATGDLGAAFSRRYAVAMLSRSEYVVAWLLWVLGLAVAALLALFWLLVVVGPVIVITASTYSLATMWGSHYRAAVADEALPPAPDRPVA